MEITRLEINDVLGVQLVSKEFRKALVDKNVIMDFLQDKRNYLLVANEGMKTIGYLLGYELHRFDRKEAMFYLHDIEVLSEYRKKGIGKALIEKFKTMAKAKNIYKIFLFACGSNTAAIKLYESTGAMSESRNEMIFTYK